MDLFAIGGIGTGAAIALTAEAEATGLQINLFWIIVSALNFILLFAILAVFAWGPLRRILSERREKIEEGLKDAEEAREARESAEAERVATLQEARREANEILSRAQKVAQETRDADIAATKAELERIRERAAAEIEAEKLRAIADVRAEVADLALRAASKVVGETLTSERERRLVEQFLAETGELAGGSKS